MSFPGGSILEAATLEALTCKKCSNFLSVPPIKIAAGDQYCGRCNVEGSRMTAYETLAKRARFPCKNGGLGCSAPLSFEQVLEHETSCTYNPLECPFCGQTYPRREINRHLQTIHSDLLVTGEISLPPSKNGDYKRLVVIGQEVFIICIRRTKNKFFLVLTSVDPKDIEYSLVIKSKSGRIVLGGHKVIPYNSFEAYTSDAKNLRSDEHVKSLLASDYTFDFEITGKEPQFQFIEELECIICNEYMKAPMFNCSTGHTLCGGCRAKVINCPMCNSPFEGGRNFPLERLLERVGHPCRNHPECPFSGTAEAVKAHEGGCLQKIRCPFEAKWDCNWSGTSADIYGHLTDFHGLFSLALNASFCLGEMIALQVIKFDDNNFILEVTPTPRNSFYTFDMKHLERGEEGGRYNFVVEFMDQTGKGGRLVVCQGCDVKLDVHERSLQAFAGPTKALFFKLNMERV